MISLPPLGTVAIHLNPYLRTDEAVWFGPKLYVGVIALERIRWATTPPPDFTADVDFPRDCPPVLP